MNTLSLSHNLSEAYHILIHIPPFVWVILAYLLYVGFKALKPRVMSIHRLILIPVALIALKYKVFISPHLWVYILALSVGLAIGYYKVKGDSIQVFKETKSVRIPGSSSLIFILIGIFAVKFYFGYQEAVNPEAYARNLVWDFALSGVLSGYFSGQRACYLYRYFKHA